MKQSSATHEQIPLRRGLRGDFFERGRTWLSHAFAVERPGKDPPGDAEREIAERICTEIVRRQMASPALVFLESFRPLNYVSAQMLYAFSPIATCLVNPAQYKAFTRFLEWRGSIDFLCRRIEELDTPADRRSDVEAAPREE